MKQDPILGAQFVRSLVMPHKVMSALASNDRRSSPMSPGLYSQHPPTIDAPWAIHSVAISASDNLDDVCLKN